MSDLRAGCSGEREPKIPHGAVEGRAPRLILGRAVDTVITLSVRRLPRWEHINIGERGSMAEVHLRLARITRFGRNHNSTVNTFGAIECGRLGTLKSENHINTCQFMT